MASHSTYLTATSHQLCAINEITDRSPRLMDEYSLSSLLQLSKASFYLAQFFRPFFNVRIDIASKGAIPTRLDFERRLKRWLVRLYNRGGGERNDRRIASRWIFFFESSLQKEQEILV